MLAVGVAKRGKIAGARLSAEERLQNLVGVTQEGGTTPEEDTTPQAGQTPEKDMIPEAGTTPEEDTIPEAVVAPEAVEAPEEETTSEEGIIWDSQQDHILSRLQVP